MDSLDTLCGAILTRRVVSFWYGDANSGIRVVEPHLIASNERDELVLCGWLLRSESALNERKGWHEYHVSKITDLAVLKERFGGPRPGYDANGGGRLHDVQCAAKPAEPR